MCNPSDSHKSPLQFDLLKIGDVAKHFGISRDLLRLYERERILIPLQSPGGTRYFTCKDLEWIGTILKLVRRTRLNFAAIRHLLALVPCWEISDCGRKTKAGCEFIAEMAQPCWTGIMNCQTCAKGCYQCPVYRAAPLNRNFRALLSETITGKRQMTPRDKKDNRQEVLPPRHVDLHPLGGKRSQGASRSSGEGSCQVRVQGPS